MALLLLAGPVQTRPASTPSPQRALPLRGDQSDGSRARPVHRIQLRDADGEVIRPSDRPLLPFSTVRTCASDCHDVATISRGWHFKTATPGPMPGRRGEPWILADPETGTQLPLSYHGWPGTYGPDEIGITPWAFARLFGARTPGGITGEREPNPPLMARWAVSGDLEPNCLACHDASPAYDHAEYGRQLSLENFRWATTAASGMAQVTGAAKEMPNTFDYLLPFVEDALLLRRPAVVYAPERFLPGATVVFDIVREVPARRCYFCHSNADTEQTGQGRWNADEDIHLSRGMSCVDCHRNGLDHGMTRGYEGESSASRPGAAVASCRGCHLAGEGDRVFARGRLGAPYPRHAGLPPIHLTKLSCTACHSGPAPGATARRLKTSQSHRLGGLNVNKSGDVLPHLYYPVFARPDDGVMTPNRLLWPAFWGRMANGTVRPILPDRVKNVMSRARVKLSLSPDGSWPNLDNQTVVAILGLLRDEPRAEGTPVYVAGGRLHRLDGSGRMASDAHPSAQPYLWQMAHDVRPAGLALGARGCTDCHDANAPVFYSRVPVDSPLASERGESWTMNRFQQGLDTGYVADFARTFRYRPWLEGSVTAGATVLVLLLLTYVMRAIGRVSAATERGPLGRVAINLVGLSACVASVASGWPALLSGRALTGYRLMIHVASAPVFIAGAVLITLFWAERNRLGRADVNRVRWPLGAATSRAANPYVVVCRKLCFWLAVSAAIPAAVSATLAMFPMLASVRQGGLFFVHRYAVWPLIGCSGLFTCCALVAWMRGHHEIRG
jgi:hypothetical protein